VTDEAQAKTGTHRSWIASARQQAEDARRREVTSAARYALAAQDTVITTPPGYEIIAEIQRGGQGVVYRARQRSTGQWVAIKVLRGGALADPRERPRFEREAQILGRLKHPNIVAIHDSGCHQGAAWLVTDFVEGMPLDQWARRQREAPRPQALRDVMRLFVRVCDAVNAAHLRGVIHRDLKPGNVLVDGRGEPRVLDFGLAKLMEGAEGGFSAMTLTRSGQFLGSLPWAAPEQADNALDQVDVRADVYALGVMLYQALAGVFPYDVSGPPHETLEHIRSATPRPLARSGRSTTWAIDGELETIALKCLAKQRERRYQSAGELGRDLERYLSGQPIDAKRDSLAYVFRKQLRRHWGRAVVAASFVLVALGAGAALSIAYHERGVLLEQVQAERDRAQEAQGVAVARGQQAERESEKTRRIREFMEQMLTSVDPRVARGRDVGVLSQMLDDAAQRVRTELADQPEIAQDVHTTIGKTYLGLGLAQSAVEHFQAALDIVERLAAGGDAGPSELAPACYNLAHALWKHRRLAEAEPLARRALELAREVYGPEHEHVARSIGLVGVILFGRGRPAEAEPCYREAFEMNSRVLGATHLETLSSANNLALLLRRSGRLPAAEELYRQALAAQREQLGDDHPYTLTTMRNLGSMLSDRGQLSEAESLLAEALESGRRVLGFEHPECLGAANDLALLYSRQERTAEAIALARESVEAGRAALDLNEPGFAQAVMNLGRYLHTAGDLDAAEPLYVEALELQRRVLPADHPNLAIALGNYSQLLQARQRDDEAIALAEEALAVQRRRPDGSRAELLASVANLSGMLVGAGRLSEAEPLLAEALELGRAEDGLFLTNALFWSGRQRLELGDFNAADEALSECVTRMRATFPPDHPVRAAAESLWGHSLAALGRNEEAEPLLTTAYERLRDRLGNSHGRTQEALERLIQFYDACGMEAEATACRRLQERPPNPAPATESLRGEPREAESR